MHSKPKLKGAGGDWLAGLQENSGMEVEGGWREREWEVQNSQKR